MRTNDAVHDPFCRFVARQPFKWLDPRLPFYKPCSPELLGPRKGPFPAGKPALQGSAGGCGRAKGAVGAVCDAASFIKAL